MILLWCLIGQAAGLGSQWTQIQASGDCGDTAGACLTMTPVDNNPKGSFLSVNPCDDANTLQTWTFDPTSGHICSVNATSFCICFHNPAVVEKSPDLRASDKLTPATWTFNPSTSALCSDEESKVVMDNGGGQGDPTYGNSDASCDSPGGCEMWKFVNV